MSNRVFTAHVPAELAREVDALAEELDRPRGWIVNEALSLYVDLERKRHLLTVEALEEVERGETVSHQSVEAWAASLKKRPRARRR